MYGKLSKLFYSFLEIVEVLTWCRMDFLVNVCGYGVEDARRTLGKEQGMVGAVESLQAGR